MYGQRGIQCESLCHTDASMMRFLNFSLFHILNLFPPFFLEFVLLGAVQGWKADEKGQEMTGIKIYDIQNKYKNILKVKF